MLKFYSYKLFIGSQNYLQLTLFSHLLTYLLPTEQAEQINLATKIQQHIDRHKHRSLDTLSCVSNQV